ncbi:hypothetical protein [Bacillus wiedmannii]|uniref:hypothetical protein n=1 Tax=Bacillus wiedmannii TaxID=1890302 RepID=UPI003CEF4D90
MTGVWQRFIPVVVKEKIEILPRERVDFTLRPEILNAKVSRIIDVEWTSKDDVPVCLTFKQSYYKINQSNNIQYQELRVCLFNASRSRIAEVDLYKIQEDYVTILN